MINSFLFTLTTFTRIPGLKVEFSENNTKYLFLFFPLIGLIIGGLTFLFYLLINLFIDETFIKALLLIAFNIIITGGIHLDGFLDSMDAISSHRSKAEKKVIIKDSLLGAFSLINFSVLMIVLFSALYYLIKLDLVFLIIIIPLLSRTFLLFVIKNSKLESDDLIGFFTSTFILKNSYLIMFIYLIIGLIIVLLFNFSWLVYLIVCALLLLFSFIYLKYYQLHFDKLNGDLCGCFICIGEVVAIILFCVVNFYFL